MVSVDDRTGQRAKILEDGRIENLLENAKAWNALTKQDQVLLDRIKRAARLLEEAGSYAATLAADLVAARANKYLLLGTIDAKTISRRDVNRHNDDMQRAADECLEYMSRIETMFATLIELEQKTDFMQPGAQGVLLNASTEIIVGLEDRAQICPRGASCKD